MAIQGNSVNSNRDGTGLSFCLATCIRFNIDLSPDTTIDGLLGFGPRFNVDAPHLCSLFG